MSDLPLQAAVARAGVPLRTLERRLQVIRQNDLPTYDQLVTRPEGKRRYDDEHRLLARLAS